MVPDLSKLINRQRNVVCFTGPRPNQMHGYVHEPYKPIVQYLTDVLRNIADLGATDFISGGAQGFDQLAFWSVEHLKRTTHPNVNNIVYVPFRNQPCRWSLNGAFSQSEYGLMLSHADKYHILDDDPEPDDVRMASHHMLQRNHLMVCDSNLVVALLAGRSLDWKHAPGGTSECVRYARMMHKKVLTLVYRPGSPIEIDLI